MMQAMLSTAGRLSCACLLGLSALAPACAQSLPPAIQPLWYATTVDMDAATATFSIRFDRPFDLRTVDDYFRQPDSFQFWTDTASADPIGSVGNGVLGLGPLGTQAVIATTDVPLSGQLTYIWPQDDTYSGPRDVGGWGAIQARGDYTLDADGTLSFSVPLALLHADGGSFYYAFETYQYGAWGGVDYLGTSGQEYWVSPAPEPSEALMLAAGVVLLAGAAPARGAHARSGRVVSAQRVLANAARGW